MVQAHAKHEVASNKSTAADNSDILYGTSETGFDCFFLRRRRRTFLRSLTVFTSSSDDLSKYYMTDAWKQTHILQHVNYRVSKKKWNQIQSQISQNQSKIRDSDFPFQKIAFSVSENFGILFQLGWKWKFCFAIDFVHMKKKQILFTWSLCTYIGQAKMEWQLLKTWWILLWIWG